jgi:hypothetical protein
MKYLYCKHFISNEFNIIEIYLLIYLLVQQPKANLFFYFKMGQIILDPFIEVFNLLLIKLQIRFFEFLTSFLDLWMLEFLLVILQGEFDFAML